MNFAGTLQERRWRGNKRRRKTGSLTMPLRGILAGFAVGASIAAADASPGVPVDECGLVTVVEGKCPAAPTFAALLDYRPDLPILKLRLASLSVDDFTGSIPAFRFDVAPPKPVTVTLPSLPLPDVAESVIAATEPADEPGAPTMIVGMASTYNPMNPADKTAGGLQTASGEFYDAEDWTAAIRLDLRGQFGGVRYGRNYIPTYALVESGDKRVIVKINDVGPLKPGRIIDLNERTMRFFDPSLQLGLIQGVRVSPLEGTEWIAGPVGVNNEMMTLAGRLEP